MPRGKKNNFLKKIIKKTFNYFNLEIKRLNSFEDRFKDSIAEISHDDEKILKKISNIVLSSRANQWSIIQSLEYISRKNISGSIVECGVFRGGSLILICLIAERLNLDKKIYGYDTFEEGFSELSEFDLDPKGKKVENTNTDKNFFPTKMEVINNFEKYKVSSKFMPNLVKGKTQITLQDNKNVPNEISFLRLDTDIYEPTLDQLNRLYPKLSKGGILHIDDYGHCPGVKKAVDEYFNSKKIWLHRVDYTCRFLIKE